MGATAVDDALSKAFDNAGVLERALADARIVIFSDLHRGTRDRADDFEKCEPAYCAALAWYLASGYELFVLGDAEELWENGPANVLAPKTGYPEVLELEGKFHRAGRYQRFYGNHDDLWASDGPVRKHLHPFFPGLKVREGLRLRLTRPGKPDGTLFFVHGHQGTRDSDRGRWLSRLFVRFVWRPIQRKSGYTGVTPARDHALRARHDRAMSAWAGAHPAKPVLITGHTHRPVFWDGVPELAAPKRGGDDTEAGRAADEAWAVAGERNRPKAYKLPTPCYFNTGCCCFGDGDVTGLEIADGQIRLVRWPDDDGAPRRKTLGTPRALDEVLDEVAGRSAAPVVGVEVSAETGS